MLGKLRAALVLLLLLPLPAAGRDGWFLALGREGAGSIYVSPGDKTAYIIDGGYKGAGGIQGAEQIRDGVLEALHRDHGVERLVVAITHPHADHAGGIRQMVTTDPWMTSFKTVVFVEGDAAADGSLGKLFQGATAQLAKKAAAQQIPAVASPRVEVRSATGRDAYQGLAGERASVVVSNFAYQPPPGADANGRSIIHTIRLIDRDAAGREVSSKLIVDTADADNAAISAFTVHWNLRNPVRPAPVQTILTMPHHGSKSTDPGRLLAAVKPTDVVFTVNDQNRHGHPHPDVLKACLGVVGPERVHFTGSSFHVYVPDRGRLEPCSPAELMSNYTTFVRHSTVRALFNAKGDDVEPTRAACAAIAAAFYGAPASRPSDDLWPGPVAAFAPSSHGPMAPGFVAEPWAEVTYTSWYKQMRTVLEDLDKISPAWDGVEPVKDARDRRFGRSLVGRPRQGGMILGNRVTCDSGTPASASLRFDRNGVFLCVEVVGHAGKRTLVETDAFPESVLWSALELVDPRDQYVLGAVPGVRLKGEVSVFGGTMTTSPTWGLARFQGWAHPALAGTPLAFQALRLDSSAASLDRAGDVLRPAQAAALAALRLRDPVKKSWAYQFFDAPSEVRAERGRLWVQPADHSARLLRLRVWIGENETDAGEDVRVSDSVYSAIAAHTDALTDFEAFARIVAVARWLNDAGVSVAGRERLHAAWIPLDSFLWEFEVAPRLTTGPLKARTSP